MAVSDSIRCPRKCRCLVEDLPQHLTIECAEHLMNEPKLDTLLLENNLGESLRGLTISNTTMTQIPWSICVLSNVIMFPVSNKQLRPIRFENNCFTNMTSLTDIYAGRNLITKLSDGISDGLNSSTSFDLGWNRISDIGLHVSKRYNVRDASAAINLTLINLTLPQDGVFYGFESLPRLKLSRPTNIANIFYIGRNAFSTLTHFPPEITRINVTSTSFTLDNSPRESSRSNQWIANTLSAVTFFLLLGYIVFRLRVRVYRRWKFHPFDRDECVGEDMDYDVFLCCSSEDSPDGLHILELMEDRGYNVYYDERDFLPGERITDNMTQGVTRSKRTVCLISENFTRR